MWLLQYITNFSRRKEIFHYLLTFSLSCDICLFSEIIIDHLHSILKIHYYTHITERTKIYGWPRQPWINRLKIFIQTLPTNFAHVFHHSFRFAQGTNKSWKSLLCLSSNLFIIDFETAIHYRARKEEWRIYSDPVSLYVPSSFQAQTSGTLSPDSYHWYKPWFI